MGSFILFYFYLYRTWDSRMGSGKFFFNVDRFFVFFLLDLQF